MTRPLALFDVDSRELDATGVGLCFRSRVLPIAERLEQLLGAASDRDLHVVFSTCCSGRRPTRTAHAGALFVPREEASDWRPHVASRRLIYVDKPTFGDPERNFAGRCFDVFAHNRNARALVEAIGADRWIVFGNGFDLCVFAVACGLLDAGVHVDVVEDVLASSRDATMDSERSTWQRLEELGACRSCLADALRLIRGP